MKNYKITVKELLEHIQKGLNSLKGKNVKKEGGISKLVDAVAESLEEPYLSDYNISVDQCRFKIYCAGLGKDIEFATIRTEYRPDKRKWDGVGETLDNVTVVPEKDIPLDLEVINLPQYLDYNIAKERFERLVVQQKELMDEYQENLGFMRELQDVMKYHAYDKETNTAAEKAEEIIRAVSGQVIDLKTLNACLSAMVFTVEDILQRIAIEEEVKIYTGDTKLLYRGTVLNALDDAYKEILERRVFVIGTQKGIIYILTEIE